MKLLYISTLAIIMMIASAFKSDGQSIQWMQDAGSTPFDANEHGYAIDADANGSSYVLGHLAIDSYFSGLFVPAHEDGCLAKYGPSGSVQWVRTFGGPGFVDIQESAVKVSSYDSAIYVCGSFRTQIANSVITFDTISYTYAGNSRHGFLAKYDLNGNIQWMKHGGGPGLGVGYNDLDIDDQGRIVVVGTVDGINLFDTLTLNYTGGILARYSSDGTLTNLIQLTDSSAEHQEAREVEVAPGSGNIYIGGAFFGNITLTGFNANSPTVFSVFEMKFDSALNCQWLTNGGGTNGSWINGLAIDGNENSYIAGHASGDTVNFGSHFFNGYTMFDTEVITVKFDGAGTPQWIRHGGSIRNDEAWDIIADDLGNTVITGFLGGNALFADFDGIQVQLFSQSTHCFLARYDSNGLITYARRMGEGSDDVGFGLALANDSTFYLTGTTWGSALWDTWQYMPCCLDPNLFVAKFRDTFNSLSTNILEQAAISLSVYPNPFSTLTNLEIDLSEKKIFAILILDVTGRIVKRISTLNPEDLKYKIPIDLSILNNGIYFCKIESNGNFQTVKLIKN